MNAPAPGKPMSDVAFRKLLDFIMVDDPRSLPQHVDSALMAKLTDESKRRGYDGGWPEAYHEFTPPLPDSLGGLQAVIDTWRIIEQAAAEAGITGPATNGIGLGSKAEQFSKAVVARLASNDPPILPAYDFEIVDDRASTPVEGA